MGLVAGLPWQESLAICLIIAEADGILIESVTLTYDFFELVQ